MKDYDTPDTVVTLGDFTFQRFEVPEQISIGGRHAVAVHRLIGGKRVLDAMGPDDNSIAWSGMFQGDLADERARYLDYLRRSGNQVPLSWGAYNFLVVVDQFTFDYQRFYQGRYAISCCVVEDLTQPIDFVLEPDVTDQINADLQAALVAANAAAVASVQAALTIAINAMSAAGRLSNASAAQVASITNAVNALASSTAAGIAAAQGDLSDALTLGGSVAGQAGLSNATTLINQGSAALQLSNLLNVQSMTGRIASNLSLGDF